MRASKQPNLRSIADVVKDSLILGKQIEISSLDVALKIFIIRELNRNTKYQIASERY